MDRCPLGNGALKGRNNLTKRKTHKINALRELAINPFTYFYKKYKSGKHSAAENHFAFVRNIGFSGIADTVDTESGEAIPAGTQ